MSLGENLQKLRRAHRLSQAAMATQLGLSRQSYWLYEQNKTQPTSATLEKLRQLFNVSVDQLLGNTLAPTVATLPVLGMASCGLTGWGQAPDLLATTTAAPPDIDPQHGFAVQARGSSLLPEGIKPGYLCLCNPQLLPQVGDIIYLVDHSGQTALKKLLKLSPQSVLVQGWLPPDAQGQQQSFTEERPRAALQQLAVVVYIKRR